MTVSSLNPEMQAIAYDMLTYLKIRDQGKATERSELIEVFKNNLAYFNRLMLIAYDENEINRIMSRIENCDIGKELNSIEERIKKELPNLFVNIN